METKKRDKSSYPGRPRGSLSKTTIKKMAVKLLEDSIQDESLPKDIRVQAALRLTEMQS